MHNNNNNLCSIFHSRFKNLIKIIPSARKAQLIDYILLGWQTSTYKLKGSEKKWFMKPYSEIIVDTGIPKSTLERYIKELNEAGFIERRQALYSRTGENGSFEVKKATYIYITDQLLKLLKPATIHSLPEAPNQKKDIDIIPDTSIQINHSDLNYKKPICLKLDINEGFGTLKTRGLYIRDLYYSLDNNINHKKLTSSVDKTTSNCLSHQFESIKQLITKDIKEEIPDEVKKLIIGTFFNLTFKHKKLFTLPRQIAAEYLFALVNTQFYLPKVHCFKNRNNILSKIIRNNNWKTPKGFYKHFYLGQDFKDKQKLRELQWEQQKENETNQTKYTLNFEIKNDQLNIIENQIFEKSTQIERLTKTLYQQSTEETIIMIREQIQMVKNELEDLWKKQYIIEQEIELHRSSCNKIYA